MPEPTPISAAGAAGSADLAIGQQKVFCAGEKKVFWTIPQEGRERRCIAEKKRFFREEAVTRCLARSLH